MRHFGRRFLDPCPEVRRAKAAQALLELVAAQDPPTRLYLGADALRLVQTKIDAMEAEIAAWESVSRSTDFA